MDARTRIDLGGGWAVRPGSPQASPEARFRDITQRLEVRDPLTGEILDLGPIQSCAWRAQLTMGASQSDQDTIELPSDSGILVLSMRSTSTGAYSVSFLDRTFSTPRPLQSAGVFNTLLFGTGAQPFKLWNPEGTGPGPMLLPPSSRFQITGTDTSAAPNTAIITLEGLRIRRGQVDLHQLARMAAETLFMYPTSFTVPAGIGSVLAPKQKVQTHGDAPFRIHRINASHLVNYDLQFETVNNSEPWFMRGRIPIENLAGTNVFPGGFSLPRGLARGEDLLIEAANRQAGAITVTQLLLIGAKDWRGSQA